MVSYSMIILTINTPCPPKIAPQFSCQIFHFKISHLTILSSPFASNLLSTLVPNALWHPPIMSVSTTTPRSSPSPLVVEGDFAHYHTAVLHHRFTLAILSRSPYSSTHNSSRGGAKIVVSTLLASIASIVLSIHPAVSHHHHNGKHGSRSSIGIPACSRGRL